MQLQDKKMKENNIQTLTIITDYISEMNNLQVESDADAVMPMNNLTEYSVDYPRTSGNLQ